eukprot:jgi/Tetstr1/462484/TSEL_007475.t1
MCQGEYEAAHPEAAPEEVTYSPRSVPGSSSANVTTSLTFSEGQQKDPEQHLGDAAPTTKRGAKHGVKRRKGEKRAYMKWADQVKTIQYYNSFIQAERPKLADLAKWATDQFKLVKAPSVAFMSKMIKNREAIMRDHGTSVEMHNHGDRKRKRVVGTKEQLELENALVAWIRHHDAPHGGKVALSNERLKMQAKTIAEQKGFVFDPMKFNFSSKWLNSFKKANNINRLPKILKNYNQDKIYNFDKTGLLYRMLLSAGNLAGRKKGRKGGKVAKERTTAGLFWNATGTDFWKPVFIGKANRPRCFGKHSKGENIGARYYSNSKAWI